MAIPGRLKWTALLTVLLTCFTFLLYNYTLWVFWGIPHIEPIFLDLYAVLSAADAHRAGYNAFIENPFDVANRVHVYSRAWLLLGATGLTRDHNFIAGAVLVITFFALSVFILRPENFREFLLSSMVMLSPAVMFAVERANNDIIIYLLLLLASLLLSIKKFWPNAISYLLLYLSTILKFYPAITFVVFVRQIKDSRVFYGLTALTAIAVGIFIAATLYDFQYLDLSVFRPYKRWAFGGPLLFNWITMEKAISQARYYIFVLSILVAAGLISSKGAVSLSCRDDRNVQTFAIGSLVLFFCFFLFSNFDYRCIFFILTVPFLFEQLRSSAVSTLTRRFVRLYFFCLTAVLWSELIATYVPYISKGLGLSDVERGVIRAIMIIEHGCSWIVMTILVIFNIELFKPSIQEKLMSMKLLRAS